MDLKWKIGSFVHELKVLLKRWLWINFNTILKMIFTNKFYYHKEIFNTKIFRFQLHFLVSNFWVVLLIFFEFYDFDIVNFKTWLCIIILVGCGILDTNRKGKDEMLDWFLNFIEASRFLNFTKFIWTLYFSSLCVGE